MLCLPCHMASAVVGAIVQFGRDTVLLALEVFFFFFFCWGEGGGGRRVAKGEAGDQNLFQFGVGGS